MRARRKRPAIIVGSIAAFLMRTSAAAAQDSRSPLDVFPKIPAGIYGADPNRRDDDITVYDEQTCTSKSSGAGWVVTTFDGNAILCLSGQGFAFYDIARKIDYSSLAQAIEPHNYGSPENTSKGHLNMSIRVVSASECYSQASGLGLTVVTPPQNFTTRRTLFCMSPLGKGYTVFDFPSGRSYTAVDEDRTGSMNDPREIRYEVGSKIMNLIGPYFPTPSRGARLNP